MSNITIAMASGTLYKSIYPTHDGYIFYDVSEGTYTHYPDTTMTVGADTGDVWRGYAEFSLNSLSSNMTFTNISLLYHCYNRDEDNHIHECLGERPSTTGSIGDLYDEIGEGTVYADVSDFPIQGFMQSLLFTESQALTDLTNSLSNGWYAIGIQTDDEGSSNLNKYGTIESYGGIPLVLYIEYTYSDSVSIPYPKDIIRQFNRKMVKYQLPDGSFKRKDIGSKGKVLQLIGTLWGATSSDDIEAIEIMMEQGEIITLSGMANTNWNRNWYILDFPVEQHPAYVNRYDYNLVLVEDQYPE